MRGWARIVVLMLSSFICGRQVVLWMMKSSTLVLCIANAGVPTLLPANSLSGFDLAIDLGADVILTSLRMSLDDHFVLSDDPIENMTWRQIQAIDLSGSFSLLWSNVSVPLLDDALSIAAARHVSLWLQLSPRIAANASAVAALFAAVEPAGNHVAFVTPCAASPFLAAALKKNAWVIGDCRAANESDATLFLSDEGPQQLLVPALWLASNNVTQAARRGKRFVVQTDSLQEMDELLATSAVVGIITEHPQSLATKIETLARAIPSHALHGTRARVHPKDTGGTFTVFEPQ